MRYYHIILILFVFVTELKGTLITTSSLNVNFLMTFNLDAAVYPDSTFLTKPFNKADTTKAKVIADTLRPILINSLSRLNNFSFKLNSKEIDRLDYRYTGNLFNYISTGYLEDLGSLGQPNEVQLYGLGFGGISYLQDGILINRRNLNSLDLNNFRSEYIDSLEVLPLPRGFLYGTFNDPIAVNFITKDLIAPIPYSRIRYYQAPNEEGYIDGIFGAYVMRKLYMTLGFTNNTINSRYLNSEYGSWKTSVKFRYMPSNFINIIAGYDYIKSNTQLNGGVNYNGIIQSNSISKSSILYSPFEAPVIDSTRYQKITRRNFYLKLLSNSFKLSQTELSFYYQYNLTEFRQNERNSMISVPRIFHNNRYGTFGTKLRQTYNGNLIYFDLASAYEISNIKDDMLQNKSRQTTFYIKGLSGFKFFDNKFLPSIFAKYLIFDHSNYLGFGSDVNIHLSGSVNLYAGISHFDKPFTLIEKQFLVSDNTKQRINTFETGIKYNLNYSSGSILYFSSLIKNKPVGVIKQQPPFVNTEIGFFNSIKQIVRGLNFNIKFKIWKLLLSSNTTFYLYSKNEKLRTVPNITSTSGIYYVDTLFNSNLKLKTGLNFYYNGEQSFRIYDFEKMSSAFYVKEFNNGLVVPVGNEFTKPSYQIDYFLAGKIQDRAIIYFVFENLLNNQYNIIPYYPKQGRGLRLGVSWEFYN